MRGAGDLRDGEQPPAAGSGDGRLASAAAPRSAPARDGAAQPTPRSADRPHPYKGRVAAFRCHARRSGFGRADRYWGAAGPLIHAVVTMELKQRCLPEGGVNRGCRHGLQCFGDGLRLTVYVDVGNADVRVELSGRTLPAGGHGRSSPRRGWRCGSYGHPRRSPGARGAAGPTL
jgi:hypothetical protein